MQIMKRVASVAVATALAAGAVVAAPGTASATAAECVGGANGFVDISDSLAGAVADHVSGSAVELYLDFGLVNGQRRGWARLTTAAGPIFFGGGEQVWMDWSRDGGRTWLQCGPFTARQGADRMTSAAQRTDPSYRFRAGAWADGRMLLTRWV